MENRLLLSVCIGGLLFAFSCNISTSRKLADTMQQDSICETPAHNMSDREVSAQEVPMRLLDKLSELYGDNPPGVIGFSVESKNCPDFIGGVYINDRDTLVIQIRGDSATGRKQLEEILGSKEFVVEPGLTYTQKELLAINEKLTERWRQLERTSVMRNVKSTGVGTHAIEVCLIVNTPEKQKEFREKVMDSPAFRFTGPEVPPVNTTVGVNDIKGVALRPEYTVYSTETKQVKFILYNHSGGPVCCGAHYYITYEDDKGVWRKLPINDFAVDILYGVENGDSWEFSASLYPDVYPNHTGRYRFFYEVTVGDMHVGDKLLMMADFRLSDSKQELAQVTKTPVPETVLGGLSEQEYREKEEHLFATRVFTVVEQMPEFPDGGHSGLLKFIEDNISKNITKEGRVVVSFVVERNGSLSDIQVIRSSSYKELDDEAIRIVRKMPKWIPGQQRGKPVKVKYTVPVDFYKEENNRQE